MTDALYAQAVAATAGLLLLTTVLQVWRRSVTASTRLLAVQGAALAGLVATIGLADHSPELVLVAVIVLAVKGVALPMALTRTITRTGALREDHPGVNPVSGLLALAVLTVVAYLVSPPLVALGSGPAAKAVPVGLTLVLIGFWLLITRRRAVSQVIGFLVIDNGIATVAFLTAGGVPFVVELGVSLDVVLVVLILRILSSRIHLTRGRIDLHDLEELRD
jgi:hydrogenase-4 component E